MMTFQTFTSGSFQKKNVEIFNELPLFIKQILHHNQGKAEYVSELSLLSINSFNLLSQGLQVDLLLLPFLSALEK